MAILAPPASVPSATTTTGPDGRFHLQVPPGRYALTATAPGLAAVYRDMAPMETPTANADVTLGGEGAFTLRGDATIEGGAANAGTMVAAWRLTEDGGGGVFYTTTSASGTFALTLPRARVYMIMLDDPRFVSAPFTLRQGVDQHVSLVASRRAAAPEEVVDWVRHASIPIATTDPSHDLSDLEPLGAIFGAARVVGLGEATHGTREFFQLKHRVLEYLVKRQGFTVFAIEGNEPEALAVNEYVLHGKGNAREAIAGMYFWTWDTEEVLAQVEWMRRWNADPKHTRKVKFLGFDMQTPHVAVARVIAYLRRVDPDAAAGADRSLAPLSEAGEATYKDLPVDERVATAKAISDLLARFDRQRAAWSARTSDTDFAAARQHAVVVAQAERRIAGDSSEWRDEAMAVNVQWILDQEPKGTRMVVWAHNAHVNRADPNSERPMGAHLARTLGKDYVALGFVFDRGGFQAMSGTPDGQFRLGDHEVGEAPIGDLGEAFHRAGRPLFALDLREAPAGVVGDWLAAPHTMREIGSLYPGEADMVQGVILPSRFDAILYVDETTHARRLL